MPRMLLKTLTCTVVHFAVAFTAAYLLTGSRAVAAAIGLVEPLCQTLAHTVHERLWQGWGDPSFTQAA